MKRLDETNSKDLDRLLRLHARPDSSDMDAAIDDVLKRDGARIGACLAGEQPAVSRLRYGPRFAVAAAVLIGIVGIGLYAIFSFQLFKRESPPPAVPPTQIAAITQAKDAGAPRLQLPRLRFAVASVRPHAAPGPSAPKDFGLIKCLGADGLLWSPQNTSDPTPPRRGRCFGPGGPLGALVLTAYASSPIARLALPPDADMPFVTIEAVADDPERVTKGELKLMLQALLEDRFKARVHIETRELDGYVLTIAKSGIKFKETTGEPHLATGNPRLDGRYTMEGVARFLSYLLSPGGSGGSMPVLDKTGLAGVYAINFALEEIAAAPAQAGVRGGGGGADPRQFTTPVPKAVEDQLGLHVERGKVPVEFIVIDNLEPLTEN